MYISNKEKELNYTILNDIRVAEGDLDNINKRQQNLMLKLKQIEGVLFNIDVNDRNKLY